MTRRLGRAMSQLVQHVYRARRVFVARVFGVGWSVKDVPELSLPNQRLERPPRSGGSSKPVLESLTTEECWRLVGRRGVGRIGFNAGSGPRIHPVDYTSDGSELNIVTSESSELARFTRLFSAGGLVTFEIDQLDARMGDRWSVLVAAQVVDAGRPGAVDPGVPSSPTPAGQHGWWLRLRPTKVTGRRLVSTSGPHDGVRLASVGGVPAARTRRS